MIDNQLRTFEVSDQLLLAAIERVPREPFVPPERKAIAHTDTGFDLVAGGERRGMLPPLVLARMLQTALPAANDLVLDVAGGSGYGAALIRELGASVVLLESPPFVELARAALAEAGVVGVQPVAGAFDKPVAGGPFSLVFVEGAFEMEPEALFDQLAEGGRLVGVLGGARVGRVMLYRKSAGVVSGRAVFDAAAPHLSAFARPPAFVFA